MNTTELLDQFVLEARECLETIGRRLLEVEREPDNRELLNDLFRQVHTLKGNCGLFEFKALERVVHAGEDLLDRVRHGDLAYDDQIADALLEAMDYTAELVDAIADTGPCRRRPPGPRAQALAAALRQHLPGAPARHRPRAGRDSPPAAPPRRRTGWRAAGRPAAPAAIALRYRPEPECFFKGEDPWHLARQAPGLVWLQAGAAEPWPAAEDFDCYRCNLDLVLVSDAPRAALEEHFRYVPEQVERNLRWTPDAAAGAAAGGCRAAPAAPAPGRGLGTMQRALLARPGLASGTQAARAVLQAAAGSAGRARHGRGPGQPQAAGRGEPMPGGLRWRSTSRRARPAGACRGVSPRRRRSSAWQARPPRTAPRQGSRRPTVTAAPPPTRC